MIIIGSDHTGITLKKNIIKYLKDKEIDCKDVTDYENQDGDDYPDIAITICEKVLENSDNLGIAICGTGIGISIACNKVNGIRAADCVDEQMAEFCKRHNNCNVLCLGANLKFTENFDNVKRIIDLFIHSTFENGRHIRRLDKIRNIEEMQNKGGK